MNNSCILISEHDGDRSADNVMYVGLRSGDRVLRDRGDSWSFMSKAEYTKVLAKARRVAQKLAKQTGLEIVEELWIYAKE